MEEQENKKQAPNSDNLTTKQALQIGLLCSLLFVIGIGIGAFGYDRFVANQRDMIEEVVAEQLAGQDAQIAEQVVSMLIEGVQGGQPRQQQPPAPGEGPRHDVGVDDDPAIGSADAPVVIIEFSDFRCPYCGRFAMTTLEPLIAEYGDYIHFVYRDFAILGPESVNAAVASECADDQEAFWAYHDLLFTNQQNLSRDTYIELAQQLELDVETFTTCIDDEVHLNEIQADTDVAKELGATGTPTFYINGRYVSGAQPLEVFARIIEEELAEAGIERD